MKIPPRMRTPKIALKASPSHEKSLWKGLPHFSILLTLPDNQKNYRTFEIYRNPKTKLETYNVVVYGEYYE